MPFRNIELHSLYSVSTKMGFGALLGLLFKHWRPRRAICENYAGNTSRPPIVAKLQLIGMVEWFVCGWQVKLCYPNVKHGPYISAIEMKF